MSDLKEFRNFSSLTSVSESIMAGKGQKLRDVLLGLLDPAREKRAVMRFDSSGDIKFDVERVLRSEKGRAELDRIGRLQERLEKNKTALQQS